MSKKVTADNMQSVTSNAVAEKIENISSYIIGEVYTGGTWIDGKKVYRRVDTLSINSLPAGNSSYPFTNSYWSEIDSVISIRIIRPRATGLLFAQIDCGKRFNPSTKVLDVYGVTTEWSGPFLLEFIYTKTTD